MSYRTITKEADAEFTERRSRFIGHAMPVSSEEDALAFVAMIKEQHGDATHNVWAYNLKNGRQRYSDDGEPQGTAGPPVLEVLQKERLVDAAVVVTRYFGGVLLGAGGLVRAYSHGAKLALEAACPAQVFLCQDWRVEIEYGLYGKLQYLLPDYHAKVLASDFSQQVTLTVRMRKEQSSRFCAAVQDLTRGQWQPQLVGECYADQD